MYVLTCDEKALERTNKVTATPEQLAKMGLLPDSDGKKGFFDMLGMEKRKPRKGNRKARIQQAIRVARG